MSTTCKSEIVPIFEEDICGGDKKNNQCVIDTNSYLELGLNANSTQQQFNQALYTAFISLKVRVDEIESIIDSL